MRPRPSSVRGVLKKAVSSGSVLGAPLLPPPPSREGVGGRGSLRARPSGQVLYGWQHSAQLPTIPALTHGRERFNDWRGGAWHHGAIFFMSVVSGASLGVHRTVGSYSTRKGILRGWPVESKSQSLSRLSSVSAVTAATRVLFSVPVPLLQCRCSSVAASVAAPVSLFQCLCCRVAVPVSLLQCRCSKIAPVGRCRPDIRGVLSG